MWGASECGDTGDPCPGLRVSWMSSFSPALLLPLPPLPFPLFSFPRLTIQNFMFAALGPPGPPVQNQGSRPTVGGVHPT